ncbi:MAG: secreted effector protein sseD [Pseudomonadota bacterium]|jgi:secreted effector protein SseD
MVNVTVLAPSTPPTIDGNQPVQIGSSTAIDSSDKVSMVLDAFSAIFSEIFNKLLLLIKQLRDVMQFYNEKKQELGWGLEVNALEKKYESIDKTFAASKLQAMGSILSGLTSTIGAGIGASKGFLDAGAQIGGGVGKSVDGIFSMHSAEENREAQASNAIAELQQKGAQSYTKTLDDILVKAREIMQRAVDMGHNLVEVLAQVWRAMSR